MFTGLIERCGVISALRRSGDAHGTITITTAEAWAGPLQAGESVAVNGVCLTVRPLSATVFEADVLAETFSRTALSAKRPGDTVNLERALRAGDRFGGHFLAGHVDGTGRVSSIEPVDRDHVITIECPSALLEEIVLKGSIACDGISLTVTSVTRSTFSVHVIPHTWRHTTLGSLTVGNGVNIETDMIGKYVRRFMEASSATVRQERGGVADLIRRGIV